MSRYYFHFKADNFYEDEEGQNFASPVLARNHGKQLAMELAQGGELPGALIIVANDSASLFVISIPRWCH